MGRLSEKVAIVTGASKGIGAGIATALGAAGARVAVNYSSDREGAERVAQAITNNRGEGIAVGAGGPRPRMSGGYSKKWTLRSEGWMFWSTMPGYSASAPQFRKRWLHVDHSTKVIAYLPACRYAPVEGMTHTRPPKGLVIRCTAL